MKAKVQIVCATQARAARCGTMLESFLATRSPGTAIWVYVDEADAEVDAYRALFERLAIPHEFGPKLTMVQAVNRGVAVNDAEFYGDANDDYVFRTAAWDDQLRGAIEQRGGQGMAFGLTLNLPSCPLLSARCVRALGHYFDPGFRHQYVDNVQVEAFAEAGMLYQVPEVWIEHVHPAFGKAQWDPTYNSMAAAGNHDHVEFQRWMVTRRPMQVAALRAVKG